MRAKDLQLPQYVIFDFFTFGYYYDHSRFTSSVSCKPFSKALSLISKQFCIIKISICIILSGWVQFSCNRVEASRIRIFKISTRILSSTLARAIPTLLMKIWSYQCGSGAHAAYEFWLNYPPPPRYFSSKRCVFQKNKYAQKGVCMFKVVYEIKNSVLKLKIFSI